MVDLCFRIVNLQIFVRFKQPDDELASRQKWVTGFTLWCQWWTNTNGSNTCETVCVCVCTQCVFSDSYSC